MMKRAFAMLAVAGLLVAGAAAPAKADDEEANAHQRAGFSIGGNAEYFRNNRATANGWYGGADVRFHLGSVLAVEGSAAYKREGGVDWYPVQGSLLLYLTPYWRLSPYVLGGGTWYMNGNTSWDNAVFGPHAGAGAELFLTRHLSLDASWRYLWAENLASGTNYFNRSYGSNGWLFKGGVRVHF